jgi:NAD(P)-dependent dehydrogenase (short-subunit alcohol dehydrogenase family)
MISSVATLSMAANGAPYNMAKAALEALALTLYKEERPNNIRVNIVAPGLVDTDMGRRLAKATMGVQEIHELEASMPFNHVCTPEDVAEVVRFLVSDRNTYVTGEKINVHGGGRLPATVA